MSIRLDIATMQLNKIGEELCGDSIEIVENKNSTIVVLSDGLGSGVKANILSHLTTKTAATMLSLGGTVDEVISTLAHTLPICKVRHLAYSTFTILNINFNGEVYLAEYDNPPTFIGQNNNLRKVERTSRVIGDKTISEAHFKVADNDWLVLVSDGVLHAGLGRAWNLEWNWSRVSRHLETQTSRHNTAKDWAEDLRTCINNLYGGSPEDDASAVVVRVRLPRHLTLLIGPPSNPAQDLDAVRKLSCAQGLKAVCGGTTSKIVARELSRQLVVDLTSNFNKIPPMGIIEGIDLVTEGTLTLAFALKHLKRKATTLPHEALNDGASQLSAALTWADNIHFIIGTAENTAMYQGDAPKSLALKEQVLKDLIMLLYEEQSKTISVEFY